MTMRHGVRGFAIFAFAVLSLVCPKPSADVLPWPDKIVIDNGYCMTVTALLKRNAALQFTWLDIANPTSLITDGTDYLNASIVQCDRPDRGTPDVVFPLTWSCRNSTFRCIVPDVWGDDVGRQRIEMLREPNIIESLLYDDEYLSYSSLRQCVARDKKTDYVRYQVNAHDGHEKRLGLNFLSTGPFTRSRLTQENNHVWYCIDGDEILARNYNSRWIHVKESAYPNIWPNIDIAETKTQDASIENGTLKPFIGEKAVGKRILADGQELKKPDGLEWFVLFKNENGEMFACGLFHDNHWEDLNWQLKTDIRCVVVDHDCDYILLSTDLTLDKNDARSSLKQVVKQLSDRMLIASYPLYYSNNKEKEPSAQPVLKNPEKAQAVNAPDDKPLARLFSDEELKELFAPPDPSVIQDHLELGLAYDWCGQYRNALAHLKQAEGVRAKFELALLLRTGRPGVAIDYSLPEQLLQKIIEDFRVEKPKKFSSLTSEEWIFYARVSLELERMNEKSFINRLQQRKEFTELPVITHPGTKHDQRGLFHHIILGERLLEEGIHLGETAGHYYREYYRQLGYYWPVGRRSNTDRIWKSYQTNDLEARAVMAWLAGTQPRYAGYRDKGSHLQDLKAAIRAKNNHAQYLLGMMYLKPNAYLQTDKERALFWLRRAAERGHEQAKAELILLGVDDKEAKANQYNPNGKTFRLVTP